MSNNENITIEYCTNEEWYRVFSSCVGDVESADDSELLTTEYINAATAYLADLGYETIQAKGQRSLLHGWNGAHFTHHVGGLGTFDTLTDEQNNDLHKADDVGRDAAAKLAAQFAEAE